MSSWELKKPINWHGGRGRSAREGTFGRVIVDSIPDEGPVPGVTIDKNARVDIDKDEYVVWKYRGNSPVVVAEDGVYVDMNETHSVDPNQQAFIILRILSDEGAVTYWDEEAVE